MDIQVFLQPVDGSGFRAETSPPWNVTAQGATREEALDRVRNQIRAKLADGSEVVSVAVNEPENPWLKLAGVHQNDPHYQDYLNAVADYRQQIESDADRP
jgi:predicted RNase H-like HicB family nuclease